MKTLKIKPQDITAYGKQVLDLMCDKVAEVSGQGHIGWSIGKTNVVVKYVAEQLGKSKRSVAGAISDLIEKGYLISGGEDDVTWVSVSGFISISHKGWMRYSKWNPNKLEVQYGNENGPKEDMDFDFWIDWDGMDGTNYPYYSPQAFP